ncbi:NnrS family protein [Colwellia sp. 1_MG-2023]|uniref:NnrS family protein n=1 Tax=Colwellia sp. 1_MG-2023 TaxID=3062649 RepID=UPI0026E23E48|nr:NnrS family protein [Colwellia sp. 1_MG-2023]MDO6446559.1 NnrS family protein [Colwellia sp. 1_MG-2023]
MMQITDLQKEQKVLPLLRLGFRPFFLFGAAFAVIAIFTWLLIIQGKSDLTPLGGGYWWHLHEMIFGFATAIIAGFLLTAVQNWTGIPGIQNKSLLFLVVLWILARLSLIEPSFLGENVTMLIDIAFLPAVAVFLGMPIVKIKQYRNLFFVPLLILFTLVNIEFYLALMSPEHFSIQLSGYAGVMLITLLMSVMVGRVGPMFTANGTQTKKVANIAWLDKATNGSLAIITFYLILHPLLPINGQILGSLFIIAAIFQAIRIVRWRPWITIKVPLLWSLHLAVIFIVFGLFFVGLSYFLVELSSSHLWHILTIGGMGGLILAMISRVSLGHTGRPLQPPKTMSLAFILIFIAAIIRSFLPLLFPESIMSIYQASAGLWYLSFGIFIFHYAPMLLKGRLDGRPG